MNKSPEREICNSEKSPECLTACRPKSKMKIVFKLMERICQEKEII